jgi:hypothetical protein
MEPFRCVTGHPVWWGYQSGPARTRLDSADIAFHDSRVTCGCSVRVLAKLAFGSPLSQQIPALVELLLNVPQTGSVVVGLASVGEQVVLFFDKLCDVVKNG